MLSQMPTGHKKWLIQVLLLGAHVLCLVRPNTITSPVYSVPHILVACCVASVYLVPCAEGAIKDSIVSEERLVRQLLLELAQQPTFPGKLPEFHSLHVAHN